MPIREPDRVAEAFGLYFMAFLHTAGSGGARSQAAALYGIMVGAKLCGVDAQTPADVLVHIQELLAHLASGGANRRLALSWPDRLKFELYLRVIRITTRLAGAGTPIRAAGEHLLTVIDEEVTFD